MKTFITNIITLSFLVLAFTGCKEKAKEAETTTAEIVETVKKVTADNYTVNIAESSIAWKGFKPTEFHNGTINLSEGRIEVTEGKVSGGTFTVDMNSIVVLDIPAEKKGNAKLVAHLKNEDFFDVEKYPSTTFTITKLEEKDSLTLISGNLKMKDATNNITFPAKVTTENGIVTLVSEAFTIDRTKWGVKYKSKSILGDLADKFIKDEIEFVVNVKAAK